MQRDIFFPESLYSHTLVIHIRIVTSPLIYL